MKLLKKYPKLHIWLLTNLTLVGLFLLTRGNRRWMNALTGYVTEPLKRGIAGLTYRMDFSVAELLYVTAIAVGVLLLPCGIYRFELCGDSRRGSEERGKSRASQHCALHRNASSYDAAFTADSLKTEKTPPVPRFFGMGGSFCKLIFTLK